MRRCHAVEGKQMQGWLKGEMPGRQVYLVNGKRVRIPGVDSGLVDIHNGNGDIRAHLCNHTAGWPSDITGTDAADLLDFEHDCSGKKGRGNKRSGGSQQGTAGQAPALKGNLKASVLLCWAATKKRVHTAGS